MNKILAPRRASFQTARAAILVADAAARKDPGSYGFTPYPTMRVRQADEPSLIYTLEAADVTLDASWTSVLAMDANGNLSVNGIALVRLTPEAWDAAIPQIPALGELVVSPTGVLLMGDGVLPARDLPLLTSVTNPFTTIRSGDTAEVRAAENWKVFGFLEIDDGGFLEIEDGGTVQILTA